MNLRLVFPEDFLVSPVVNNESLTTIDDVCSEKVTEGILKAAECIYEIISTFAENVCNRSFNADNLLLLNNMPTGLTMCHTEEIEDEEDQCDPTVQALSRNLGGFNLTTNAVPKDRDCAFRSLARMLSSVWNPQQPEISTHLNSIGLSKSEDEDTITISNLFVDEILKCDDEILAFFPEQSKKEITTKALQFRRQGMFDTAIVGLVMRVCAQLLRRSAYHGCNISQFFALCSLHFRQPAIQQTYLCSLSLLRGRTLRFHEIIR